MGANADVVRSAWEGMRRQDLDAVTATMDNEAETVLPGSLPWGGTYLGPDGFKEMIGQFMSELEDFRPSPEAFLEAEGQHVVVPVTVEGQTNAGKDFSDRVLWLYTLRDGKIIRAELFADTASTLDAVR
jgi:ketosteroid isomerase-like protein